VLQKLFRHKIVTRHAQVKMLESQKMVFLVLFHCWFDFLLKAHTHSHKIMVALLCLNIQLIKIQWLWEHWLTRVILDQRAIKWLFVLCLSCKIWATLSSTELYNILLNFTIIIIYSPTETIDNLQYIVHQLIRWYSIRDQKPTGSQFSLQYLPKQKDNERKLKQNP